MTFFPQQEDAYSAVVKAGWTHSIVQAAYMQHNCKMALMLPLKIKAFDNLTDLTVKGSHYQLKSYLVLPVQLFTGPSELGVITCHNGCWCSIIDIGHVTAFASHLQPNHPDCQSS